MVRSLVLSKENHRQVKSLNYSSGPGTTEFGDTDDVRGRGGFGSGGEEKTRTDILNPRVPISPLG